MGVPENVRELKRQIVERSGGRKDDVEFTFVKGRWRNLGEATLMNRVKSHTDVSERWVRMIANFERSWIGRLPVAIKQKLTLSFQYPDLLTKIREEQAGSLASKQGDQESQDGPEVNIPKAGTTVEAH